MHIETTAGYHLTPKVILKDTDKRECMCSTMENSIEVCSKKANMKRSRNLLEGMCLQEIKALDEKPACLYLLYEVFQIYKI